MATNFDVEAITKSLNKCVQEVGSCTASIKVKVDNKEICVLIDNSGSSSQNEVSVDYVVEEENVKSSVEGDPRSTSSSVREELNGLDDKLTKLMDKMAALEVIPERLLRLEQMLNRLDVSMDGGLRFDNLERMVKNLNESENIEEILTGNDTLTEGMDELKSKVDELSRRTETLTGLGNLGQCFLRSLDINYSALKFHPEFMGMSVALSNGCRSATRKRPHDCWGNAAVTTERPLNDGEMFSVRVDNTIKTKKPCSIAIGVVQGITHTVSSWDHMTKTNGTWSLDRSITTKGTTVINGTYPLDL